MRIKLCQNTKYTSLKQFNVPEPDSDDTPQKIEDCWYFVGKIKSADGNFKFNDLVKVRVCLSDSTGQRKCKITWWNSEFSNYTKVNKLI